MKRRNFIGILAGLAAVPTAVKSLFDKLNLSIDMDKIAYVPLKIYQAKEDKNGYLYYEIDQNFAEFFKHAVWTTDELERIRGLKK